MSNILLVKTSSLGDVLHNLPVVSDIVHYKGNVQVDWLVEQSFAALPRMHSSVHTVIPVALRKWRHGLFQSNTRNEISAFRNQLKVSKYDLAIDTQGLLKSAVLMLGARGLRCGYDWDSAREPAASLFYQRKFSVAVDQHAVERNRQLVGMALGYTATGPADYGIRRPSIERPGWLPAVTYAVLLHATSRDDKLWSEDNWVRLGKYFHEAHIHCIIPWGSEIERSRSLRLAAAIPGAITPPHLDLDQVAFVLGGAYAVIGVDTGIAHLAAALNVPTVGIYTSTDPSLTGLHAGNRAINLGGMDSAPSVVAVIDAVQQVVSC